MEFHRTIRDVFLVSRLEESHPQDASLGWLSHSTRPSLSRRSVPHCFAWVFLSRNHSAATKPPSRMKEEQLQHGDDKKNHEDLLLSVSEMETLIQT